MPDQASHVVFIDQKLVFEGSLAATALAVHAWPAARAESALIFNAHSGADVDLDLRGSVSDVAERYPDAAGNAENEQQDSAQAEVQEQPRKRGRPKLGVVGREITLLPRHWEWLDRQRGGASAALRRLVDENRKSRAGEDAARRAQDRTARVLTTLAGNLPEFEEALRALYARDKDGFLQRIGGWPADVQTLAKNWSEDAFAGALST